VSAAGVEAGGPAAPGAAGGGPPGGEDLRRSATRGAAAVVGSRLGVQVLTLAVTFLVARILSPYDYAVITCCAVFVILADTLALAGIGPALVQKPELEEGDLEQGFTLSLGLSVVFTAVLFASARPLAQYFLYPELTAVVRLCSLQVLLSPFRTVPVVLLERRMQLGRHSAIFTASMIVQSVVNVAMAVAGYGYWSLAVSSCVARVLDTVAYAWLSGWVPRLRMPGPSGWGLLRFGLNVTGSALLWQAYSQADFAIAAKVAPQYLGYYGLAFQIISMPSNRIAVSFSQAAYAVFCRLQDQRDQIRDWYLRLVGLMGAVALPIYAGMALVADDGVRLVLGEKWAPAVVPLQILCVPGYALFLMTTLHPVMNALGRSDLPAKYNAVFTLTMPAAFLILGRRYGLVGICSAWAVFYPVIGFALIRLSRPVLGFGLAELARAHRPALASAAVMAAAVLGVQHALPGADRGATRLALAVGVGVAVYAASIWVTARGTVIRDFRVLLKTLRG